MKRLFFCLAWCWLVCPQVLFAQGAADTLLLEEVVVTATRSEKRLIDIPVPITLIARAQIEQMGSLRLGDVLQEQTGLNLINDHGQGLQMQGFDPDYTLILIDGEPIIGRTAGTLDLSRLAVGNIKQIEIVRGPSSSLYGSEALAGVVNIITQDPQQKGGSLSVRYGANQTSDLGLSLQTQHEKWGINFFLNRYASGGYDLNPQTFGQTVEPFLTYTAQSKFNYDFSDQVSLSLSGRYFWEQQESRFDSPEAVAGQGTIQDYNLNPVLRWQINPSWKTQFRTYLSGYHTQSELRLQDGSEGLYESTFFDQRFFRIENQTEWIAQPEHLFTFGIGQVHESVAATRYTQRQTFLTQYGFLQYEFVPNTRWNASLGGRFDSHSVYGTQLSPKAALQYKISPKISLQASVGQGFKAPDFRQLYLNFTNAVAGYAVFGTEELPTILAELITQGQIAQVLLNPEEIGEIQAEISTAYNVGFTWKIHPKLQLNTNLFHNEVQNLIESRIVAIRNNGQSIFSYQNLNHIFTQGAENDLTYCPSPRWRLSAGYQFLLAKDREVLRQIDEGELFGRSPDNQIVTRLTKKDYGGLFGRSRHTANLKIFYQDPQRGITANLRGIFRGRYGWADRNGNLVLDQDNEYVSGFWLWNAAFSKTLWKDRLRLQAGCDNLLNFRNPEQIPGIAGRLWWLSAKVSIHHP
ncbi:MAG: TonB-dependent receptor plug domain-containing protein [Bernardetiaceae bacterium]